ncbi:MAG: EAL domain-containing protein [Thiotrichales bacterium]|nr:EAL domain-containing protein [Thiotrichales bacterium]
MKFPSPIASIKNRLILSIALLHALLMSLFVYDLVQRQEQFLTKESQVTAEGIAKALATNSVPWMLSNDLAGLAELTQTQAQQAHVNFAMLFNMHGKILAYHHNRKPQALPNQTGLYVDLPPSTAPNQYVYFDNPQVVDLAVPIFKNQTQLGWARIQLSRQHTQESIALITREGVFYTLAAILIGSLIAGLMGHHLTHRITRLIQSTKQIRLGQRQLTLDSHGQDELAELTRQFAAMLQALEKQENALFEEKERAEITLRSIGDAVVVINQQGRITYLNPAAQHLTAWSQQEAMGRSINEVMQLFDDVQKKPVENPALRALELQKTISIAKDTILINRLGNPISLINSAAPIIDRNGQVIGAIMVFHDATEERKLQHRLHWQANHDALTELYNRSAFEQELERLIQLSHRSSALQHYLLYLDLDQFKIVNDTVGHTAGDLLLKQVAVLLQQGVETRGFLSRLGGDEFAILASAENQTAIIQFAEQLRQTITDHRLFWDGKSFQVGCSIGVAAIHGNLSKNTILSRADIACYLAKDKGRNRIEIYQEDNQSLAQDQQIIDWVNRIKQGLENEQFLLYAQQIVNLQNMDSEQGHFEILVRMRDEQGQIIPPSHFLPAAERFDLMSQLDLYIAERALNWLQIHAQKIDLLNINISGQSLGQAHFTENLLQLLEKYRPLNHKLCFEITETAAISQMRATIDFLHKVKSFGCKLALDDFGSGFASFSWLKTLPIDFVKIDGSFIQDVLNDPVDAAMVRTIRDISQIMHIKVVAEFVETQAISDWLKAIGIHYAQGYHYDQPKNLQQIFTQT